MSTNASRVLARDSKKRSPVGRSVVGSDHRVGSDEKHEDQRWANTRAARDDGTITPAVAAVNAILC